VRPDLRISSVCSREVYDSRGNPTVEADVRLAGGAVGRAIVPSGASTGIHEALELRDGGARHGGRGVCRAVENVAAILGPAVAGLDASDQRRLDAALIELDGTPNKSRLGANAILAVSMAAAHAAAAQRGAPLYRHLAELFGSAERPVSLPVPLLNIINGGLHADNNLDIQEYMIAPYGFVSFREAMRAASEIYSCLRGVLRRRGLSVAVGDEGGFAPQLADNQQGLATIVDAIAAAGYRPGTDVGLALDSAASNFLAREGVYKFEGREVASVEMTSTYAAWLDRYPIVSYEDPLAEEDWAGWRSLTARLGRRVQVVGDDIFCTNVARIAAGVSQAAANAVLVKVNQIGTLTETAQAIEAARAAGWTVVISHRSGETEDTTVADLAVGLGAGQIKAGAPCRSERVAKYNRLLRIEEELGAKAVYAGEAYRWRKG
jgi:enolase